MRIKLKEIDCDWEIGECGIVDFEIHEGTGDCVYNKQYKNFDKKELYWTIYDQIILPTRAKMDQDKDDTLRLFYIEEKGKNLEFTISFDEYDEAVFVVKGATEKPLEEVLQNLFNDMRDCFPDDEEMREAITWDKSAKVNIPEDYVKRIVEDVFYSHWIIEE